MESAWGHGEFSCHYRFPTLPDADCSDLPKCPQARKTYKRKLQDADLPLAGDQDVCHIISESRGGANHPANYIVLGRHYNRKTRNHTDVLTCYLAGLRRTEQAIRMSILLGNMRGKGKTPHNRRNIDPSTVWRSFNTNHESHEWKAEQMYNEGRRLFHDAHLEHFAG